MRHREKVDWAPLTGERSDYIFEAWPPGTSGPRVWTRLSQAPIGPSMVQVGYEKFDDDISSFRGVKRCVHQKGRRMYSTRCRRTIGVDYYYIDAPPWMNYTDFIPPIGNAAAAEPTPSFGADLTSNCLHKTLNEAPERVAEQSFQFIKDLRETALMIRNPFEFLKVLAKKPSRLGRNSSLLAHLAENGMTATSNGWLQYQFGWKPLLHDIYGVCDALGGVAAAYQSYLAGRNQTVKTRKETSADETTHYSNDTLSEWPLRIMAESQHKARCILWCELHPANETLGYADFVTQRLGLNAGQLIPAVWDAIPYSFIVDWFIPIGDKLSDMAETPVNFDIVQQMYDYTRTDVSHYLAFNPWPLQGGAGQINDELFTESKTIYTRGVEPFVSSNDSSWYTNNRALDLLALIKQRLRLPLRK